MTVTELIPSGTDGIIKKIRETVGDGPVYLSIDVRTIAAGFCYPSYANQICVDRLHRPCFRTRNWYPRDRWVVDKRTSYHSKGSGRPPNCFGGYCRSSPCIRHECRINNHGMLVYAHTKDLLFITFTGCSRCNTTHFFPSELMGLTSAV